MSGKWNNVLFLSFNFRVKHYSDHVPWELPTHSLSLFHVCAWNWQLCKPCTGAPFPLWPQKRQAAALWAPPVLTERSSYILLRSLSSTHAYSMQALSPLWRSGQGERRCDIRGGWSWPGLCYQSLRCLQWPSSKRCALSEPSDPDDGSTRLSLFHILGFHLARKKSIWTCHICHNLSAGAILTWDIWRLKATIEELIRIRSTLHEWTSRKPLLGNYIIYSYIIYEIHNDVMRKMLKWKKPCFLKMVLMV